MGTAFNPLESYIQGRMFAQQIQSEQQRQVFAKEEEARRKEETASHIKYVDTLIKGEGLRQALEVHNLKQQIKQGLISGTTPLSGEMLNTPEINMGTGFNVSPLKIFQANPIQSAEVPTAIDPSGRLQFNTSDILSGRQQLRDLMTANMTMAAQGKGMEAGAVATAKLPSEKELESQKIAGQKEVAGLHTASAERVAKLHFDTLLKTNQLTNLTRLKVAEMNNAGTPVDPAVLHAQTQDAYAWKIDPVRSIPDKTQRTAVINSVTSVGGITPTTAGMNYLSKLGPVQTLIDEVSNWVDTYKKYDSKGEAIIAGLGERAKGIVGMSDAKREYDNIIAKRFIPAKTILGESGRVPVSELHNIENVLPTMTTSSKEDMRRINGLKKIAFNSVVTQTAAPPTQVAKILEARGLNLIPQISTNELPSERIVNNQKYYLNKATGKYSTTKP